MNKLTHSQSDTLRLIARSSCDGKGWVQCSPDLFKIIILPMPDELVEKDNSKARLTSEAKTILKWL